MKWLMVVMVFFARDLENADAQLWTLEFESQELCEAAIPVISAAYRATISGFVYAREVGSTDASELIPMSVTCLQTGK